MKSLLTLSFVCLCLIFIFPVHAAISEKPIDIAAKDFPKVKGNIVKSVRYADATGENLILLTETDVVSKPDTGDYPNYPPRSKELFAYRFLIKKGGKFEQVWQMTDSVRDCDLDGMTVSFIPEAFRLTDLNNNNKAEIWMTYVLQCAGDPSPITMKIIMYEDGKKYAVQGETRALVAHFENGEKIYAGGEYVLDKAFNSGPKEFAAFAKELWEKYKNR